MIQNHMHSLKKRPVLIGVLLMGMRNSLARKITEYRFHRSEELPLRGICPPWGPSLSAHLKQRAKFQIDDRWEVCEREREWVREDC